MSRVKIADFADAIGEPSELCRDRDAAVKAGYPDVIAPPTFAVIIDQLSVKAVVTDPGLGLDYSMVVHGEQSFSHARPLHAGDVVVATTTIESVKSLGAMSMLVTSTSIDTVDGEHVCTAQVHPRGAGGGLMSPATPAPRTTASTRAPSSPPRSYQVTRLDLVKYAGASGDFNIIHWNERVARAVGLPNVIAHGMYTMAEAGRFVTEWAGGDPGAVTDFGVRFSAMVPVPDDDERARTIEFSGKVLEKLAEQQGHRRHRGEGRRGEGADPRPRDRPPPVIESSEGTATRAPRWRWPTTPRLASAARRGASSPPTPSRAWSTPCAPRTGQASRSCLSAAAPTWSSPTRASPAGSSTSTRAASRSSTPATGP